jgi:hypothetical protein
VQNVFPNSTNAVPDAEGVGLCKALEGYVKWWKEVFFPGSRLLTCDPLSRDSSDWLTV